MPNPNTTPDPQNVYILEDFFRGQDVEKALLKADELNDTKLEFLQAAQDAVDSQQVSSADDLIHTITVVEKVVEQIPVTVDFKYATNIQFTTEGATLKAQLIDQDGAPIGDVEVFSIPTGSIVVDGSYDSTSGNIILTLENGNTIEVPATAFQNGLQAKIDANNKLSVDYLIDGNANKVFTAADKAKVNDSINAAGSGLTVYESSGDKIVKHTNSVSAVTTAGFNKVTYDAQGHITGSQSVTKADVTALNLNGADVTMTGYVKPTSTDAIVPTDTVNQAIGKLEKAVEDAGSGDGTVKSVAVSMPTGFTVTGSPITESGTIAVAMSDGYSIPTDTKQAEWDQKLANTVTVNSKLVSENPVLDGGDIVLTGYQIASEVADVAATDTINEAIGKLQKTIKEGGGGTGDVSSVASNSDSISIVPTTGNVKVSVASGYAIPEDSDITNWNSKMAGNVTINSKSVADSPTLDGTDIELTGYEKPSATSAVEATDTVNEAIGKLEKAQEHVGKTYSNSSAGWAAQPTLVSELNAIYVYTDFDSADGRHIPAMKIGDGVTRVVELPFSAANGITATKIAEWDSKVSAALSTSGDTLLLY